MIETKNYRSYFFNSLIKKKRKRIRSNKSIDVAVVKIINNYSFFYFKLKFHIDLQNKAK